MVARTAAVAAWTAKVEASANLAKTVVEVLARMAGMAEAVRKSGNRATVHEMAVARNTDKTSEGKELRSVLASV